MRMNWRKRLQFLIHNPYNDIAKHLPLWSEVPTRPTDPLGIEAWERDNVMRKYWASRLENGYNQTNIVIRDTPFDPLPI